MATSTSSGRPAARAAKQRKGRQPARQGSREEILDVALDMFSRLGFDGVSTGAIAAAVGLSQPVILYHFETKDVLWRSAMERLAARVTINNLLDQATYKDLDVLSRLRIALRRFVHVSATHPALGRVLYKEGISGGPRLDWLYEHVLEPSYRSYQQMFEEAIAKGIVKNHDPRLLMIMAHAAAATLFNLAPLTERLLKRSPFEPEIVEAQADMVVDTLLEGLRLNS